MQGYGESAPKRRKTGDSLTNLISQARQNNNYSEVLEVLKSEDFESPFLAFARLDSEEDAIKEAKGLYEECFKVFSSGHKDSKEVIDLLLGNKSELGGGNVLHGLVFLAVFAPKNQAAVYGVFIESQNELLNELLKQENEQKSQPLEFARGFLSSEIGEIEKIFLKVLDLGMPCGDLLHDLMRVKNHEMVVKIHDHPKYHVSIDEYIMFLVYKHKYAEMMPKLQTEKRNDPFFKYISDALIHKRNIAERLGDKKWRVTEGNLNQCFEATPLELALDNGLKNVFEALLANGEIADFNLLTSSFKTSKKNWEFNSRKMQDWSDLIRLKIKDMRTFYIHENDKLLSKDGNGKTIIHDIAESIAVFSLDRYLGEAYDAALRRNAPISAEVFEFLINNLKQKFKDEKNPQEALREFLNVKDNAGETALHKLIKAYPDSQENVADKIIGILIENGADINLSKGVRGESLSVTRLAVKNKSKVPELISVLIVHGLDLNTPDIRGQMPFHHVARYVDSQDPTNLVDSMIEYGAEPNSQNKSGKTALMISAEKGRISMFVSLFERQDVDKRKRDSEGSELLQIAALSGNTYKISFLLRKEIYDVHHVNDKGCNALCFAALSGNIDVVKKFIELGLNPNLRSREGKNIILDLLDNKILKTRAAKKKAEFSVIKDEINRYIKIYDRFMGILYANLFLLPESLQDQMLFDSPNSTTAISFKDYGTSINHDRDVSMSILLKHAIEKPEEIRFLEL